MSTIVSAFIQTTRRQVGDLPEKHEDIIQGDGSSTVYRTQFSPILEGSYALYIDGVLKTEGVGSDYTIDKDTGDIVLAATTSSEIKIQYKSVNYRDDWWIDTIKDVVQGLGDSYFRTVVRSTSAMALSAGVSVYPTPSNCILLTEVLRSDDSTSAGNFVPLSVNHWFDRRSKKLVLGSPPTRAGYLSVSYLRQLGLPATTADTLDLEDQWLSMVKDGVKAEYARSRAVALSQRGNVSVEEGHLSIQGLRQMSNDFETKYERKKRKLRPLQPSMNIPYYIHGGGSVQHP